MTVKNRIVGSNYVDLFGVLALTLLALFVLSQPARDPFGYSLFVLPLVFMLPGYALTIALFPRGRLQTAETLAFSLGLSLAAVVGGGVLLNTTPFGLEALPWTVYLTAVTLGGCAVAAFKRRREEQAAPVRFSLGLSPLQVCLSALSLLVLVGALWIARDPSIQPTTNFTGLWARPAALLGQSAYDVGVYNSESSRMEYKLEVKAEGVLVYEASPIALAPGETWERVLRFDTLVSGEVLVLLYRLDRPGGVYRYVVSRSDRP